MRERTEYLLRKTSDNRDLSGVSEKLKDKKNLNGGQASHFLKGFRKLGISPITLPNSCRASTARGDHKGEKK